MESEQIHICLFMLYVAIKQSHRGYDNDWEGYPQYFLRMKKTDLCMIILRRLFAMTRVSCGHSLESRMC